MLLKGEVVLACGLRRDSDKQGSALTELRKKFAPGLEFGDTVGAPASAKEVDNQRSQSQKIGGIYGFASASVFEGERRSLGADGEDSIFDTGGEEVRDHLL